MSPSQRSTLTVTMLATFLAVMDQFIINVALPSIRSDLHASAAEAEFAVSGYALVYGALLITGGRLGDLFGYRRLFVLGVATFTLASLGCGLAPTAEGLIAFRLVQGIGSALFYPQILSFLQTTFDGQARTRAFSMFGAAVGLASVCGQVLGGLLVGLDLFGMSWRPVFLINVPLGLAALAGAMSLPRYRGTERPLLDLRGLICLTSALLLLSVPLVGGPGWGWPWWSYALLALALPAMLAFVLWERRVALRGGMPLMDPGLFRRRVFATGNGLALAFFASNAGLFFVLTLHLQQDLGRTPLESGLTFAPLTLAFIVASLSAPRIQHRLGLHVLTCGYGLNLVGVLALFLFAVTDGPGSRTGVPWFLPAALTVIGLGQGLGVSPLLGALLSDVPRVHAGAASGVVETTAQVGASLGTAGAGLVFRSPQGHAATPSAFSQALTVNVALSLTALLLMALVTRPQLQGGKEEPFLTTADQNSPGVLS
ncbi:MFS transporter [Streptomyces eurocidicus]|nr:MFS transporter [Streptomyces eurocidicus]MBF6055841.1 MFS transporter [Streptomyces eurocidicus]